MKNSFDSLKNDLLFLLTKNEIYFYALIFDKNIYKSQFPLNLSILILLENYILVVGLHLLYDFYLLNNEEKNLEKILKLFKEKGEFIKLNQLTKRINQAINKHKNKNDDLEKFYLFIKKFKKDRNEIVHKLFKIRTGDFRLNIKLINTKITNLYNLFVKEKNFFDPRRLYFKLIKK
jgi:hypothetical protein